MKLNLLYFLLFLFGCATIGCKHTIEDDAPITPPGDLSTIPYNPQEYTIIIPDSFPNLPAIEAGSMTIEGVNLGRHLFYDPILSEDLTQSCSTCHEPAGGFTDNLAVSVGIDDIAGKRSSMSLLNIVYNEGKLFWDGRATSLEEQALLPVEDPIELHNTWPNVIDRFKDHDTYPTMFRKAFGIEDRSEITKELAAKAIAQFERTLVSSGMSRYDRVVRGETFYSDEESMGEEIFFDLSDNMDKQGECGHCHGGMLFTTDEFFNNGLDGVSSLADFADYGLGDVSQEPDDNGKFRAPSLRNIMFTAPYMHDGRFETIEEVIDHYFSGGHVSPNIDGLLNDLRPRTFTTEDRDNLIAFLKTLNDVKFMENPAHQSPF